MGILIRLTICFLFLSSSAFGATYYVMSTGSDTSPYDTTAKASTTIQNVFDTIDLSGDDIVEVCADSPGGSKTFNETVTPAAADSGTSGHPVILRARSGDTITLDGQDTRANGIALSSVDYFTVDGFTVSNHTGTGIYGRTTDGNDWTIQNCVVNISLSNGITALANQGIGISGVDVASMGVKNLVIHNNLIQTGEGNLYEQTDGITVYYTDTATISNNTVSLHNANQCNGSTNAQCIACGAGDVATCTYQHIDGIQTGVVKNLTVKNNYIDASSSLGLQGIFIEGASLEADASNLGAWLIYNNLIYGADFGSTALGVFEKYATTDSVVIYNNTIIDSSSNGSTLFYSDLENTIFKNNILKTEASYPSLVVYLTSSTQTPANMNNNIYLSGTAGQDLMRIASTYYTWAEWQTAAYDANSYNENPLLDGSYKPTSSSNAIGNGADLSGTFTTDIIGATRALPFDIGAYEKVTAPTLTSAVIDETGNYITFYGSESLLATISTGFTLSITGGALTCTYVSGSGTGNLIYSLSRTVLSGQTGTYDYTQPGNGVEDLSGNDLSSITGGAITNNSTSGATGVGSMSGIGTGSGSMTGIGTGSGSLTF